MLSIYFIQEHGWRLFDLGRHPHPTPNGHVCHQDGVPHLHLPWIPDATQGLYCTSLAKMESASATLRVNDQIFLHDTL